MIIKRSSLSSKGVKKENRYFDTLQKQNRELSLLFEQLSKGIHPNFLTVLAAISKMVAINIDCDIPTRAKPGKEICMSQNKCRFCS